MTVMKLLLINMIIIKKSMLRHDNDYSEITTNTYDKGAFNGNSNTFLYTENINQSYVTPK